MRDRQPARPYAGVRARRFPPDRSPARRSRFPADNAACRRGETDGRRFNAAPTRQCRSRQRRRRGRGALRRRQSGERRSRRRCRPLDARRQHADGAALRPVPARPCRRRRLPPQRSRRPPLCRFPQRIHRRPLRPFEPAARRGGQGGGRRRRRARRPQPPRRRTRGADLRPLPVGREGALLQLRHRGEPLRDVGRPHVHRPRGDHGVQRRLPRRRLLLRPGKAADQRAVPVADRALQRHRGDAAADRCQRRPPRRHRHRTDDGRWRRHRRRAGIARGHCARRRPATASSSSSTR